MAGGITLTNLANYSLGIANDETAINIQKLTVRAMTEKILVKDKIGRVIGRVDHDLHQEYTVEGFVAGSTGALGTQIGTLMTVAGATLLGGLLTGSGIILDEVQVDYESAQLAKVNYKLTRYNDITSTATQTTI
jgi:hypothetical protein